MSDIGPHDMSRQLALLAHRQAINEIAEIQQRIALRDAVTKRFGGTALPLRDFTRSMLGDRGTMARAPELMAGEHEADLKRLDVLQHIVVALEAAFRAYRDAEDQAFAAGLADYLRRTYPQK